MLLVGYVLVIIWSLICGITKYSGSDTFLLLVEPSKG